MANAHAELVESAAAKQALLALPISICAMQLWVAHFLSSRTRSHTAKHSDVPHDLSLTKTYRPHPTRNITKRRQVLGPGSFAAGGLSGDSLTADLFVN